MYTGCNDGYGGRPMARLAASLKALLWGLREHDLEQVSEIMIVEWVSRSVRTRVCEAPEMQQICQAKNNETPGTDATALEGGVTLRILTVDQDRTINLVQPALARISEVHAYNAAAQRAKGSYLLRLDQDTVVGPSFMRFLQSEMRAAWPHVHQPWFGGRRDCDESTSEHILQDPITFLQEVDIETSLVAWDSETSMGGPVGIMGLPAWLWRAVRGYDERYVAWGHMELELYNRLSHVSSVMPVSNYTDVSYPFYHIMHNKSTLSEPVRQANSFHEFTKPVDRLGVSKSNSMLWGLASMHIPEEVFCVGASNT